jgi:hypothetical protein
MKTEEAARELEEAQMAVADTAAEFVDGGATIVELRKTVADWRKAGQALHDAVRADAKAPNVDETLARASAPLPPNRRFVTIEESPVLCQHWGGEAFHAKVRAWAKKQFKNREGTRGDGTGPCPNITDRWSEPGRIFVRLVQAFGELGYVGRTRDEVDDSDYGCLQVTLSDNGPTFKVLR